MNSEIDFASLFEGFQATPVLWDSNTVEELEQILPNYTSGNFIPKSLNKQLRLGKWVEEFVSFQLKRQKDIEIITENLQIKKEKQTIGELDILFLKNEKPVHLEIVYKFYLYDNTKTYSNRLEHWIGPNRNDTLIYKLGKLKSKQLPLLYRNETFEILKKYNLNSEQFAQHVCFKGQLFLPYNSQNINIEPLNTSCIYGYYITFNEIKIFRSLEFYIPKKLEWLSIPNNNVVWMNYNDALKLIENDISEERSVLVWIKYNTHKIDKYFITWW